ncbi:MAG: hypothetical protein KME49_07720 [Brasilonema octagenarum HA4186-MV1]|jgi:hypothetical protein|uniref:Uncharacterized protein n=2 Tax=Brasilonema TaxID=383614 RepID=A0A856MCN0_9CYAN|nr:MULTISPECIES: hypothetical protein [Brasilonema]MBW4625379.1 hypothetical protein [Brasilonema octagenarum HA4186-MV1]NMF66707.1 hypothetical protein [Brasilonema octagenarum UFV-OR1]QDL08448.1 hypothetical protein DP114_11550 [Brasilonema sennae CENA114]QDL14804.1 hypothetical protein DP113_11490 [Brasilonema octagenarum UFV-E1]
MPENSQDQNTPLTLENFWNILNSKPVSLITPGGLVVVAVHFALKSELRNTGLCLLAAVAVWFVIKIGNKIAPRIDKLLDWILNNAEILLQNLWAKLTSHFEGKYYERLEFDCREYETQGINQETLLLENLFVPLKIAPKTVGDISQNIIQQPGVNPLEQQEIGNLLVRMTRDDIKSSCFELCNSSCTYACLSMQERSGTNFF